MMLDGCTYILLVEDFTTNGIATSYVKTLKCLQQKQGK